MTIQWADGHQSAYDFELLRWNCPCAECAGEMGVPASWRRHPSSATTRSISTRWSLSVFSACVLTGRTATIPGSTDSACCAPSARATNARRLERADDQAGLGPTGLGALPLRPRLASSAALGL